MIILGVRQNVDDIRITILYFVVVQEKEKAQGREPMLQEERGFGEYTKPYG